MPSLGSLYYTLNLKDLTDADLQKVNNKLKNLGVSVDTSNIRNSIESAIGNTPFNASVSFGNAKADLYSIFQNSKFDVDVRVIASKLYDSITAALDKYKGETTIVPKKKELRKAVNDALLSAGFEISIDKTKNLTKTLNNVVGASHTLNVSVDSKKLANAIDKAVAAYKGKDVSLEIKEKTLKDSIRNALRSEKFPIKVIINKAEAQDAVRQALQAAGLQGSGFTASDKRAFDAQSRRIEANARAAAAAALAQRRLANANRMAAQAAGTHTQASISLGKSLKANLTIAGELGPMLASAYSIVALKGFLKKVIDIGGELEKQKLAMNAILGDAGMANTISEKINTLAVKSPFGIMDLNQYAKQLTAFQIPYNELYDTMKRMADISAAVGVDMGRIILAYGQVRAAKFLKGTELRQFTEANIPLIDMLAQRFTKLKGEIVSAGDIMDMVSKKEISFEDVKEVLWELTGEGGRFYNMQEVLSESLQAKWKNLADAIDLMFADIADSLSKPLTSVAEILTELTSRWKTIASVVGSAAAVFGIAKVIAFFMARSLNEVGEASLKAAANQALLERRNARLAQSYRALTAEEKANLTTKIGYWGIEKNLLKSLTNAQFEQLATSRQITKAEWERMIALGRLSNEQKAILANTGVLTAAEQKNIRVLSGWRKAFLGVGNALRGVGRAMLTLVTNPMMVMTAAIGAVTALWQRNSEEARKVKEMGENMQTSAVESAKNLAQILNSLPTSARGMNSAELSGGLEKLTQAIKDYSKTADRDLIHSFVNQKGEAASLEERYEALRAKLVQLKEAQDEAVKSGIGLALSNAVDDADGGWLDDNLLSDIEDLRNAYAKADTYLAKVIKNGAAGVKNIVAEAKKISLEFAAATSEMKTEAEMYSELVRNSQNYLDILNQLPAAYGTNAISEYNSKFRSKEEEFKNEFQQVLEAQKVRLAMQGIVKETLRDTDKINLIEWFERVTEGLPEKGKQIARSLFENMWDVDIDDGKAEKAVIDKFGQIIENANPELARKLKSGVKINDLELMDYSGATFMVVDAASKVMKEMPQFHSKIQGYLNDNSFMARIMVMWQGVNGDSDIKKMLWSGDAANLTKEAAGAEKIFDKLSASATTTRDVQDAYIKEGKDLKERIKAAKSNKAAAEELAKLNQEWNTLAESYRRAHFGSLEADIKDSRSKDSSDPFADKLKQRFKDVKDAWSEFQKWSKTEGRDAAAKRIGESGLFSTLDADKIPKTIEDYRALVKQIEDELRKDGVKGTKRESLLNELLKQLLDIDKTVVDEQLKVALDTVTKEAERQIADWNLYDKIRKATGNEQMAMSIAFGLNADATTDYPTMIKEHFSKTAKAFGHDLTFDNTTLEQAQNLGTEIAKSYQDTANKLEKYAREQKDAIADILNEYQSLQDKLAKIDSDRERKLKTVNESDMSDADKAKYTQRINVEADYKKFTQSNDYLQFFSGIYSLTMDKAQQIGDKIRYHLNEQLQAGRLSAEDYYKEIERINQQLTKLRNVKSDAMTFMTSGVKGLQQKKLDKADSDILAQMTKVKRAEEELAKAKAEGEAFDIIVAEQNLKLAKESLKTYEAVRDAIIKDQEKWQKVADVANIASNIAGGMSDAFNTLRDMADSFGFDADSNAWNTVGAVVDTLTSVTGGVQKFVQSAMSGDIGGMVSGAFDTLLTPFTIWNKLHDKKLQKMIERSKEAAQIIQNQYDILEKQMKNFLGNAAMMAVDGFDGYGGAYGKQLELMKGQLKELEKQRQAEIDKKKTDDSVVRDYEKQIDEMKIAIKDFAIEAANAVYGIDLNGWAQQIGDALVDAFAKGEDAAKAFDRTVSDIMRSVVKNIITQNLIAPMMKNLEDYLFGENGVYANYQTGGDFTLDEMDAAGLAKVLQSTKSSVEDAKEIYDYINQLTGGMLNDTDNQKSGLSAGIQGVTEDTADLLASYVNAIRADVSANRVNWDKLLENALPQMNVIAESQLQYQKQIAENTLRNAVAAEAIRVSAEKIAKYNESMEGSWRRIATKTWGSY